MSTTRRDMLKISAAAGTASLAFGPSSASAQSITSTPAPLWRRGPEDQRRADLGDGRYFNPVISGDRADPAILKDGDDYYLTHSSFVSYPGIVIWHSRDLVNWTPIGPALTKRIGSVLAMDIAKVDGRYFIYIPVFSIPSVGGDASHLLRIFVIHADSMAGPWSEPIDMGIYTGIDPGHIVGEDGKRYLYVSDGQIYPLTADGLHSAGEGKTAYDGWKYPEDWIVEGFALEGPKLLRKDGWFYMFSAEGGTAGPPTSHMIVVARSRSVHGPWENCPHNPVVRTKSRYEPWWSRGHGTAVEGPDGRWWLVYHGYENEFRTLGRQMLLEPMEWDGDGWPRALGGDLSKPLPMPAKRKSVSQGIVYSGPFSPDMLGVKLAFYKPEAAYLDRASFENGAMVLKGQGGDPQGSSPLTMNVGDRSYTVTVEIELLGGARGGLLLWYDEKFFCGLGRSETKQTPYKLGKALDSRAALGRNIAAHFHLKVVNDANVASFYSSADGENWSHEVSFEVSGYNHNVADGFLSLRPALFAHSEGAVRFRNLRYSAQA